MKILMILMMLFLPSIALADSVEITVDQYDTGTVTIEYDLVRMAEYLPESGPIFEVLIKFNRQNALIYPAPVGNMMCAESSYRLDCFFRGTPVEIELRKLRAEIRRYIESPDGM